MSGSVYWTVGMTIEDVEKQVIVACLRYTEGNREKTAEMLGIGLRTLYDKIKKYELKGVAVGETSDSIQLPVGDEQKVLKVAAGKEPCAVVELQYRWLINHEEQIKKNHANKTVEQLNDVGGLSPIEIYAVVNKLSVKDAKKKVNDKKAIAWLVEFHEKCCHNAN